MEQDKKKVKIDIVQAVRDRNLKLIRQALEEDSSCVNDRDGKGRTPLYWCAQENRIEICKILLEVGEIDLNLGTNLGENPLMIASLMGNSQMVKLLLGDYRIDLSRQSNDGCKMLYFN